MAALVGAGFRIFVEIGPNPVLRAYLHDALRAAEGQGRVLGDIDPQAGKRGPVSGDRGAHAMSRDTTLPRADRFDGPADLRGLPLYPWQKERFWFERTVEGTNPVDPPFDHPLLGFRQHGPIPFWLNHLDPQVLPWLADHAIEGVPVLPAAAVLEMALAAARLRRPDARAVEVVDVELRRPLPFDKGRTREIRTVVVGEDGDWELSSRPRLVGRAADPPCRRASCDGRGPSDRAAFYRAQAHSRRSRRGRRSIASPPSSGSITGAQFRTVTRIELLGSDEAVAHLDSSSSTRRSIAI